MDAVSVLADISLVLVVVEFMLLAAIPFVALYCANMGMRWLNARLRPGLRRVRAGINKAQGAVEQSSQAVVKPFVVAAVYAAQARGLVCGLGKALSGKSWRCKEGQ